MLDETLLMIYSMNFKRIMSYALFPLASCLQIQILTYLKKNNVSSVFP